MSTLGYVRTQNKNGRICSEICTNHWLSNDTTQGADVIRQVSPFKGLVSRITAATYHLRNCLTGCVMFNTGKEIRTVLFTAQKSVQAHVSCHIYRQSAGLMVAQVTVSCVKNEPKSAGFWLEQWPTRHENWLHCFSSNFSFPELYESEGIWQLGVHGMYRTVVLSIEELIRVVIGLSYRPARLHRLAEFIP